MLLLVLHVLEAEGVLVRPLRHELHHALRRPVRAPHVRVVVLGLALLVEGAVDPVLRARGGVGRAA